MAWTVFILAITFVAQAPDRAPRDVLFHLSVPIDIDGQRVNERAKPMTDSMVVSSGVGWRFGRRR